MNNVYCVMFPRIAAVNGTASGASPLRRQKQSNSVQKKRSRATVTNALNSARIRRAQPLIYFPLYERGSTQSCSCSTKAKNNLSRTGPLSQDSSKRDFARQQHVNCIIHRCPYVRVTARRGTQIFGTNKQYIKTIRDVI